MKELSIEQKAKAYDEAIKAAVAAHKDEDRHLKATLERIFPELKESEDERIRRRIIHALHSDVLEMSEIKEAIAWLEKQGEHAKFCDSIQVGDKVTRNQDGVLVNLSQLNRVAKKDEKQGEQKPADKVEPFDKFEGLTDFERTLADICIGWIGEELGWKQYIKDNADILLKIAVKKFNSVQDAPFEQKSVWSEEDERIIMKIISDLDYCKAIYTDDKYESVDNEINWLKSLKDRVQPQPKQEWSEKDEEYFDDIVQSLRNLVVNGGSEAKRYTEEEIDWLKSLKPHSTWKPTEEQLRELHCVISGCSYEASILVELEKQLKNLL